MVRALVARQDTYGFPAFIKGTLPSWLVVLSPSHCWLFSQSESTRLTLRCSVRLYCCTTALSVLIHILSPFSSEEISGLRAMAQCHCDLIATPVLAWKLLFSQYITDAAVLYIPCQHVLLFSTRPITILSTLMGTIGACARALEVGWRRSLLAQEEREDVPGKATERNSNL